VPDLPVNFCYRLEHEPNLCVSALYTSPCSWNYFEELAVPGFELDELVPTVTLPDERHDSLREKSKHANNMWRIKLSQIGVANADRQLCQWHLLRTNVLFLALVETDAGGGVTLGRSSRKLK
jgi:hypothetical protein